MEVIAQPTHISAHARRDNVEQEGEEDDILISLRQPESGCNANVRQEQVRKRPSRTGSPEIERVKDEKSRKEGLRQERLKDDPIEDEESRDRVRGGTRGIRRGTGLRGGAVGVVSLHKSEKLKERTL